MEYKVIFWIIHRYSLRLHTFGFSKHSRLSLRRYIPLDYHIHIPPYRVLSIENMSSNVNLTISREDNGHDTEQASKLEATLGSIPLPRRPMSLRQSAVYRHAEATDQNVNELEFEYNLNPHLYPLTRLNSLQEVFGAVQYHQHLSNDNNFSGATSVKCLRANHESAREYSQDLGVSHISWHA
jgi:hypothetical protein